MTPQHHLPADIERTSMGIITARSWPRAGLLFRPKTPPWSGALFTTADFDYAENLRFTPARRRRGVAAMRAGGNGHHRHQHGAGGASQSQV